MIILILFLGNSSPKWDSEKDSFLSCHGITCSKLRLCFNLITVPYPVGWPQQLWDSDAPALYNATPPLSSLSSHLCCMFMLMMCQNSPARIPPNSPRRFQESHRSALLLCKDTKLCFWALKIQPSFWDDLPLEYWLKALRVGQLGEHTMKHSCSFHRDISSAVRN